MRECHKVYELENGKKSMAYINEKPWHGLGQELTADASIEKWADEAGLNWQLLKAPVKFDLDNEESESIEFPGQHVIYRSDNNQPLSVVSDRYQIVQPLEVLDFFREFVEAGDMQLETAGSLANGSKIWALARVGADFNVNGIKNGVDMVKPYVLLATSCDKSIATTGQLTSVRVVCNNTLNMSLAGSASNRIKVPHSRVFDASEVKQQMGLAKESIEKTANTMRKMHSLTVSDQEAMTFFIELLKTPTEKKSGQVDLDSKRRAIPKIWESYKSAPGAESTVWGMVNAVTHSVDFNKHARTDSARLNAAWFGAGAVQKDKAFAMASDEKFLDSIADNTSATQTALDRVLATVDI